MISTLKFLSKAICRLMVSQRVVFPAADPPATPTIIFLLGSSTKLDFLGFNICYLFKTNLIKQLNLSKPIIMIPNWGEESVT